MTRRHLSILVVLSVVPLAAFAQEGALPLVEKVALQPSTTYVFTLEQKPPVSTTSKRVLRVGEYIPS